MPVVPAGRTPTRTTARIIWRGTLAVLTIAIAYALAAVVLGLIPVNTRFTPAGPDGIEIFLVSGGIHSGLAVPATTRIVDWRKELPPHEPQNAPPADYVIIGWGDRAVYTLRGGWNELQPMQAVTAMAGLNPSVVRAEHVPRPSPGPGAQPIRITPADYARLADHVRRTLARGPDGRPVPVAGAARHPNDAFYEARGSYSVIYTCNEWTRAGLAEAGVRTPLWSPFDRALFWQLR